MQVQAFYTRLFGKISRQFASLELVKSFQIADAELLIIAYGCTARAARAAVCLGREQGMKIGLLQLLSLWPFPRRPVSEALAGKKAALVPEMNMGQLRREVVRVDNGKTTVLGLSKMAGAVITPDEVLQRLREVK